MLGKTRSDLACVSETKPWAKPSEIQSNINIFPDTGAWEGSMIPKDPALANKSVVGREMKRNRSKLGITVKSNTVDYETQVQPTRLV